VDSETFEIISLAPVFDNGMGLCSHCKEETVEAFIEYGSDHVPFAYYSFDDHIPGIVKKCAVGEYPKSWIGMDQAA